MKQRILVIDDDELVRSGLAADLDREGFAVETADCGEAGLAALARAPADLVLCDLVLGDIDGIDVLRRIKTQWPETAVVMITGHGTIRNALDALRSGASDYIAKPADPEEVAHRLRTVLDAEHLRRSLAAERGRSEARRREIQEQLIRSERMASLGMLAGGAAEDLKHILVPVQAHAAALRELMPDDAPAQELIRSIEEAGQRAAAVVEDLAAIGPAGRHEKSLLSLNQVIDRYLKSPEFQHLKHRGAKVRLDVRLDPALPAIRGAADALARCVAHVMAHAFESVLAGGLIVVETRAEHLEHAVGRYGAGAPGEYVVMVVRDSGPELTGEELERLFEPFYNRAVMGRRLVSGLGMTYVHRVITEHKGFIDVRTAPGKGNTCLIHLPFAADEQPLELKADHTGSETVLVVDDYEEHRREACDMLRDLGYRVISASNGREAVRLFETALRSDTQAVDLLVVDLVLGDEFDGVETFKKIIELKPGLPAVLVSGFADIARIVEARKLGIRQRIQKPYTAESLGAAVRSALDG